MLQAFSHNVRALICDWKGKQQPPVFHGHKENSQSASKHINHNILDDSVKVFMCLKCCGLFFFFLTSFVWPFFLHDIPLLTVRRKHVLIVGIDSNRLTLPTLSTPLHTQWHILLSNRRQTPKGMIKIVQMFLSCVVFFSACFHWTLRSLFLSMCLPLQLPEARPHLQDPARRWGISGRAGTQVKPVLPR